MIFQRFTRATQSQPSSPKKSKNKDNEGLTEEVIEAVYERVKPGAGAKDFNIRPFSYPDALELAPVGKWGHALKALSHAADALRALKPESLKPHNIEAMYADLLAQTHLHVAATEELNQKLLTTELRDKLKYIKVATEKAASIEALRTAEASVFRQLLQDVSDTDARVSADTSEKSLPLKKLFENGSETCRSRIIKEPKLLKILSGAGSPLPLHQVQVMPHLSAAAKKQAMMSMMRLVEKLLYANKLPVFTLTGEKADRLNARWQVLELKSGKEERFFIASEKSGAFKSSGHEKEGAPYFLILHWQKGHPEAIGGSFGKGYEKEIVASLQKLEVVMAQTA